MELQQKLAVLADAAKYDASCASSGSIKRNSKNGSGIGSTDQGMGICHSYAPDGRCISLLKILLTNFCIYDCSYCINRASSQIERARFTEDEVVNLTLDFYKRNYIEGLFLSSGIIQSSDYTMEQMVNIARTLRKKHDFRGYIHLKTIPDASPELLRLAGLYADRLSINIELPSKKSLKNLAPEKNSVTINQSMGFLKENINESKESRKKHATISNVNRTQKSKFIYSPAGQSTQMIVGADSSNDAKILTLSNKLYNGYQMRRVYYSAFSPIPDASLNLPAKSPPLIREHRLYQADWLLRFYGFNVNEITPIPKRLAPDMRHHNDVNQNIATPDSHSGNGMLDLDIDPKLSWAIRNRDIFPVNINTASLERLMRVPGIGAIGASKIIKSRRIRPLRVHDISRCNLSLKKIAPFIEALDANPANKYLEQANLKQYFLNLQPTQMALF